VVAESTQSDVAAVVLAVAVLAAAVIVVSVAVVGGGTAAAAAMSVDCLHRQEHLQLPHAVQSLYTAVSEAADWPVAVIVAVLVADLLVIQTAASVLEFVVVVAVVAERKI
jgi:hypothetical protein